MNQIRGGLTRLKNRVSEKLNEEQDVLGFPGVNKTEVIGYIDRAYGLLSRLEPIRGTFAIVALKRKLIPELEACKVALDAATADDSDRNQFDQFLNGITKIHDDIYLTYVVFCSEGLKIEAEVGTLGSTLETLKKEINDLQPTVATLAESITSLEERNEASEEALNAQTKNQEQSAGLLTDIEKAKTSALASAEVLTKYENNAKNEQETINSLARRASKTEQHIKKVIDEVSEKTKLIEETLAKAVSAAQENNKQQQAITKTLEAASKYGMAASFKERKDELKLPMLLWSTVFVLAISALVATAIKYIVPQIASGEIPEASDVLIKLTLVSPLIWLGWMAAKQYGYIARIREDYSFKFASALAFEGYKKEASNVDPALLRDLLKVATNNMALNPLRIYSHEDNDASPIHDAFGKIFRAKDTSPTAASEEKA